MTHEDLASWVGCSFHYCALLPKDCDLEDIGTLVMSSRSRTRFSVTSVVHPLLIRASRAEVTICRSKRGTRASGSQTRAGAGAYTPLWRLGVATILDHFIGPLGVRIGGSSPPVSTAKPPQEPVPMFMPVPPGGL